MYTISGLGVSTVKYVFLSMNGINREILVININNYHTINSSRLNRPSSDIYHELSVKWIVMSGLCTPECNTLAFQSKSYASGLR